jgi:outer membrane biosynthesis protein TonB
VREPVITETSGFPELDDAAVKVAKATRYAPAMEGGTALPESCVKFKVRFQGCERPEITAPGPPGSSR